MLRMRRHSEIAVRLWWRRRLEALRRGSSLRDSLHRHLHRHLHGSAVEPSCIGISIVVACNWKTLRMYEGMCWLKLVSGLGRCWLKLVSGLGVRIGRIRRHSVLHVWHLHLWLT